MLHKTRKRVLDDEGLTPMSYMVWSKQSLQDGQLAVRIYDGTFSIRLPIKDAVEADYDSLQGFVRLENLGQYHFLKNHVVKARENSSSSI